MSSTAKKLKRSDDLPRKRSIRSYFTETIRIDGLAELELLLLTFCVGIQDATTFPDYHCFASNQTGNTVLLAVSIMRVGHGDLFRVENIGVSLGCFLSGSLIIGQLGHVEQIGQRRRIWLLLSNILQTLMVFGAAGLQYRYGVEFQGASAMGVLALLSFASGAQVVLSRAFKCSEISTAMATAAWVDLVGDGKLWQRKNHPRDRRLGFLVALFAGAVVGACMWTRMGSPFALLISAVGKAIVTIMFCFNKPESEKEEEEYALP